MVRKNKADNPAPKRAPAKRAKRKAKTPAEDEAVVSRSSRVRSTGRGGRGR